MFVLYRLSPRQCQVCVINVYQKVEVDWFRLRATNSPEIIVPAYPHRHNFNKGSKPDPSSQSAQTEALDI